MQKKVAFEQAIKTKYQEQVVIVIAKDKNGKGVYPPWFSAGVTSLTRLSIRGIVNHGLVRRRRVSTD